MISQTTMFVENKYSVYGVSLTIVASCVVQESNCSLTPKSKIIYQMDRSKSKFNINLITNGQKNQYKFPRYDLTFTYTQFIMN